MANTVMSEEERRTVANLEGLDVEQLIRIIANARGANVREVKPSVFFDAKAKYCSRPVWDVPARRPSADHQGGDVDCFIDEEEAFADHRGGRLLISAHCANAPEKLMHAFCSEINKSLGISIPAVFIVSCTAKAI